MRRPITLAVLVMLGAFASTALAGPLPNLKLTPGVTNPAVTQATIGRTICKHDWTKTVRPPVSYTNKLKREQIAEYGYANKSLHAYEEDHRVPLSIGGAPRNPKNLWPEPRFGKWNALDKDVLEWKVHRLVCSGDLSLQEARTIFLGNWQKAYAYFYPHRRP